MRILNVKQKQILDLYVETQRVKSIEDLTDSEIEEVNSLNPHETIHSNIERYLSDKEFDRLYKR